MEEKISAVEALKQTAIDLGGIKIPIALYDEIGAPIAAAIQTILAVIDSATNQEQKKEGDPVV